MSFEPVAVVSVQWANPYTEPPGGGPRSLWSCSVLAGNDYREIESEHAPAVPLGGGWAHTWTPFHKPMARWSPEAKARVRRRNLRRRLDKKFPLLAGLFEAQALSERAAYFDPEAIAKEEDET